MARRKSDWCSVACLVVALVVCAAGLILTRSAGAQGVPSQDVVNMHLQDQIAFLIQRVDRIENAIGYGLVALVGNLIAHVFQVMTNLRMRKEH